MSQRQPILIHCWKWTFHEPTAIFSPLSIKYFLFEIKKKLSNYATSHTKKLNEIELTPQVPIGNKRWNIKIIYIYSHQRDFRSMDRISFTKQHQPIHKPLVPIVCEVKPVLSFYILKFEIQRYIIPSISLLSLVM